MSWNEPGGGNRDPWSGSGRDQRPPDLNDMFNRLQEKLRKLTGGKTPGSGSPVVGIVLIALVAVLVWLASGFYVVDQGNRGVVLRFGQFSEVTMPGPHWHLPFPIEQVRKVNVAAIRTVELGYQPGAGGRNQPVLAEALMLTKDENIANVQLAVHYLVSDPENYLFKFRDPDRTLKEVAESVLREVVGQRTMDFVLTEGRAEVIEETRSLLQAVLDRYELGLDVRSVELQDIQPPEEVQGAFADAIRAREDEQRFVNEAHTYANKILPQAKGEAARMREEAIGYKTKVVAEAHGGADRFVSLLTEYRKAPEVTRERLYIETVESVLANSSKVLVGAEGSQPLFYLPLDKLTGGRGAPAPEAPAVDSGAAASAPAAGGNASARNRGNLRSREAR
jgi:membrane protease subunit HflK